MYWIECVRVCVLAAKRAATVGACLRKGSSDLSMRTPVTFVSICM
jgi:hypothetical protein